MAKLLVLVESNITGTGRLFAAPGGRWAFDRWYSPRIRAGSRTSRPTTSTTCWWTPSTKALWASNTYDASGELATVNYVTGSSLAMVGKDTTGAVVSHVWKTSDNVQLNSIVSRTREGAIINEPGTGLVQRVQSLSVAAGLLVGARATASSRAC